MPKSNLYTRTGDKGTTALVGGSRISKDNVRLEAYGTIDEFSSFLGAVLSDPLCGNEIKKQLLVIQNLLFEIGCYLASPVEPGTNPQPSGLSESDLQSLESWIDELDEKTPSINAFVLPGGSPLSAKAHIARAVCRRAERRIFTLGTEEYVAPLVTAFINRLSDYLFILARYFNFVEGVPEIKWQPKR